MSIWILVLFLIVVIMGMLMLFAGKPFTNALKLKLFKKRGYVIVTKIYRDGRVVDEVAKLGEFVKFHDNEEVGAVVVKPKLFDVNYTVPRVFAVEGFLTTYDFLDFYRNPEILNTLRESSLELDNDFKQLEYKIDEMRKKEYVIGKDKVNLDQLLRPFDPTELSSPDEYTNVLNLIIPRARELGRIEGSKSMGGLFSSPLFYIIVGLIIISMLIVGYLSYNNYVALGSIKQSLGIVAAKGGSVVSNIIK